MKKVIALGVIGVLIVFFAIFCVVSLNEGGHLAGPTYISPGNVGLRIDNYRGVVENDLMPPGLHWQGMWETVVEIPTMQRTLLFEHGQGNQSNTEITVNTSSNMLTCDVTVQYSIRGDKAPALYNDYQDTFTDLERFEGINIRPAVTAAVNDAVGDLDTAEAMTTAGKSKAEAAALKQLTDEWTPRGIEFRNLFIRTVEPDEAAKDLLHATTEKLQQIENAKLALQQQKIDNATAIQNAVAAATIDRARDASLTDLYVQDQLLGRVHTIYLPSNEIMGMLKK